MLATGGGARMLGSVVDWIYHSGISFSGRSWSTRFQRQSGETATTSLDFGVICPEPLGSAPVALAALALRARSVRRRRLGAVRG
jgi:hypothetical protein